VTKQGRFADELLFIRAVGELCLPRGRRPSTDLVVLAVCRLPPAVRSTREC
jgi:hypothetical protein